MKVAILGGAFDPIHNGHVELSKCVLDTQKFDQIWIMPCNQHMYAKDMVSTEDRLKMCQLAIDDDRIMISDYEIKNNLSGPSFNLITSLNKTYNHDFSLIIGQDNAETIDKWYKYQALLEMVRFVVIPRKGYTQTTDWYDYYPHMYLNVDIPEMSSTLIRKKIKCGESVKGLIPHNVEEHILSKQLYK